MATAILFKNADLYAPEHKGIKQILTVNDKIIAVEDEISADLPGLEVIDLNGAIGSYRPAHSRDWRRRRRRSPDTRSGA